jgi:hypothetical protein
MVTKKKTPKKSTKKPTKKVVYRTKTVYVKERDTPIQRTTKDVGAIVGLGVGTIIGLGVAKSIGGMLNPK